MAQQAKQQQEFVPRAGLFSTLGSIYSMLTTTVTRTERVLDNSLHSLETLSEMAVVTTDYMKQEQVIENSRLIQALQENTGVTIDNTTGNIKV